jgi:hypothetical protein
MAQAPKPNRPTIESLRALTVAEIAALPAATLCDLQDEMEQAKAVLASCQLRLFQGLDQKYSAMMTAVLRSQGKATGTVHHLDGDHDVTFVLSKKDVWDQEILRAIWDKIENSGEEPLLYMKRELSVPSAVLANMPAHFKTEFLAALTTIPARPTYRLAPAKARSE